MRVRQDRIPGKRLLPALPGGDQPQERQDDEKRRTEFPEKDASDEKGEKIKMIVERSEYKGRPMLVIKRSEDEKFPFSFGLAKAKMILETIEEIKKFVAENDKGE
jgi:hypothetical protein